MGAAISSLKSKNESSAVIAKCTMPPYCLKCIGSHHFLVAGGGGAAKTGISNEIDLFMVTYNNDLSMQESQPIVRSQNKLEAKQAGVIDTTTFANMNMDAICLDDAAPGRYLIVTGQDQYCSLFEATNFSLFHVKTDDQESKLSFNFQNLCRIITDYGVHDPYQKCVKLYRFNNLIWMATGGSDGCVRIWNVFSIISENKYGSDNSEILSLISIQPTLEIRTGDELVDDLDVSVCGSMLGVVRTKATSLYSTLNGELLVELNNPLELGSSFKVRSLKFLPLSKDMNMSVFIIAYNQRIRSTKEISFLALWAYNKEENACHIISIKQAAYETISCLAVSKNGTYTAFGTMNGSVGIFDSHNLHRPLYFTSKVHSSFVTSVEFLPRQVSDSKEWLQNSYNNEENGSNSSASLASVISLSVDRTVRLHSVDSQMSGLLSATRRGLLLKLAFSTLIIYVVLCVAFVY